MWLLLNFIRDVDIFKGSVIRHQINPDQCYIEHIEKDEYID